MRSTARTGRTSRPTERLRRGAAAASLLGELGQDVGGVAVAGAREAAELVQVAQFGGGLDELVGGVPVARVGEPAQLREVPPLPGEFDELVAKRDAFLALVT